MNKWNGKRFSIYDNEEKQMLGLVKKLGDQTNYNTDEVERLTISDNKKVSHQEMQDTYKIDKQSNFTGSWWGIEKPTKSNEGLATTVENLVGIEIPSIKTNVSNLKTDSATKVEVETLKNRVDEILSQQGDGTKDSEVVDGRISYDGKTYKSLGTNIRQSDLKLSKTKCTLLTNLFDKTTAIIGGYYNLEGVWTENTNIYSSPFLPVEQMEFIINPNYQQSVILWNENKQFVGYTTVNKGKFSLVGRDAKYYTFYGLVSNLSSDMLLYGDKYPSQYIPFGTPTIDKDQIKNILSEIVTHFPLEGKTIYVFGDSRTWYNGNKYTDTCKEEIKGKVCVGYQQEIIRRTKSNVVSFGYDGRNSEYICARIKEKDFSTVDIAILDGGVNDYIVGGTLGEIKPIGSVYDTSTVYGAWQSAIEHIMSSNPKCKIIVNTPFVCWNVNGKLPSNIALAKKEIANLYSLDCLDLYNLSNINEFNRDNFFADDFTLSSQWRLHLNDFGNKWIGSIISNFILSKYY